MFSYFTPYSPLWILVVAAQVFFAVHAYRRGKPGWLIILFFFPGIGSLVYLFAEYLPAVRAGGAVRSAGRTLARRINPAAEIRRLEDQVELAGSVNNRSALAEAYLEAGRGDEAIALYHGMLTGVYEDDPRLLAALARACYVTGRLDEARDAMSRAQREGSTALSADSQLLAGRIAEDVGELDTALAVYTALAQGTGEEARCRQALLLQRMGRHDEARAVWEAMLRHARLSSAHFRREQKEWLDIARREAGAAAR